MFVNISPADYNMEESVTTMVYGSRAKMITNDTQKNVESRQSLRMNEAYKKMQGKLDLAIQSLKANNIAVPEDIAVPELPSVDLEQPGDEEAKNADVANLPDLSQAPPDGAPAQAPEANVPGPPLNGGN
jgi:hypothetical protein